MVTDDAEPGSNRHGVATTDFESVTSAISIIPASLNLFYYTEQKKENQEENGRGGIQPKRARLKAGKKKDRAARSGFAGRKKNWSFFVEKTTAKRKKAVTTNCILYN